MGTCNIWWLNYPLNVFFFPFCTGDWTEWSPCFSLCVKSNEKGYRVREKSCNPSKYSENGGCEKAKLKQKEECKAVCDPEGIITIVFFYTLFKKVELRHFRKVYVFTENHILL